MATVTNAPPGLTDAIKEDLRFCPRCGADLRETEGYSINAPLDETHAIGVIRCVACVALFSLQIQVGRKKVANEQA